MRRCFLVSLSTRGTHSYTDTDVCQSPTRRTQRVLALDVFEAAMPDIPWTVGERRHSWPNRSTAGRPHPLTSTARRILRREDDGIVTGCPYMKRYALVHAVWRL